ncbi:MAG: short-chain dehydrogenase [Chitinophagaceae bacterium]|nr:short-chain dehydrogenase [Chitinophagaceae bacterium]
MTAEMIEKFVSTRISKGEPVNIHFKDRGTVTGLFIHTSDYEDLRSKNFWRIVNEQHAERWKETKDQNLARIFNGASFTRLSESES